MSELRHVGLFCVLGMLIVLWTFTSLYLVKNRVLRKINNNSLHIRDIPCYF